MKAAVFHHPKKISVDNVPDPKIEAPRDIVLRVTSTAICGSDLHIYNGVFPQMKDLVLGHEFMGVIEEIGPEVAGFSVGDRVVVPFPIACGRCWFCAHRLPTHCENSNPEHYGPEGGLLDQKGGGLFGYTDLYGGYSGGQAEYVRVPYADFGVRRVPEELSDEQVLFLSDILPTGLCAVDWAQVGPGDTVAVFGCGPVGLMSQKLAWIRGATRVIGVDVQPYRLAMAERAARSETIDARDEDVVERIRDLTGGRGADVCIDAVGLEVDRSLMKKISNVLHLQRGSLTALELALSAVRRGGRISVVGVYATTYDNFPLGQMFDKGVSLRMGQALAQNAIDELLELVRTQAVIPDDIITHRLPLEQAPHAYEVFNAKKEDCVKVVLKPHGLD